jgi:glycosyltransferase involved in cell wall biosynthesis/GR25 family glycosyltransferase involved in LPS biosynthesis
MEVKKNNYDRKLGNGFEYKDTIQFLYETIPGKRNNTSTIISSIHDSIEVIYTYTNEFDYKKYFSMYPDLIAAGIDTEIEAYKHWIQSGKKEGRCAGIIGSPTAYIGFEWESYLAINNDLRSIGVLTEFDAYMHWCTTGRLDNRHVTQISGLKTKTTTLVKINVITDVQIFNEDKYNKQWAKMLSDDLNIHLDWKYYITNYADLDKAGVNNQYNAFIHWVYHGKVEGRIGKKTLAQIELEKKLAELEKQKIAELEKQKMVEFEKKKLAELEKQRLVDLEKKRLADLEKQKLADLEKQKLADLEKKRLADLEKQKLADLEKQRLADLEKQRLADLEKQRLADLEKQRLADMEKQRLADLEKQRLAALKRENIPMYIINLQERFDKKVDMLNQMNKIEYTDYQFFKASDKNTPIVQQKYEFYEIAFEQKTIRTIPVFYKSSAERKVIGSIGAVGLIQSTIELFKQIENDAQEYVIICEDDAQFHKAFKYMLKPIRLIMHETDMVYLGYNSHIPAINTMVVNDNTKIIEKIPKSEELNTLYGTYGYICSSKFRRKIIELGIDWFINNNCTIDYGYNVLFRDGTLTGAIPTGEHLIIPDVFDQDAINGSRKDKDSFYKDRLIQLDNYHALLTPKKRFVFIVPSYNNSEWISRNLQSVFEQTYTNWRMIYINDCSTDSTHNKFLALTTEYSDKITYLNNTKKYGQAFNRYRAYNMCADDDICIMLDGDDWLASKHVLSYLNKFMQHYDADMTYGRFEVYLNGKITPFKMPGDFSPSVIEKCSYRTDSWRSCHLRTMKASLLKQIRPTDLFDEDGEFIICSTDMVESFACLELSAGRHKLNPEVTMVYNKENSMSFASTSHYSDTNKEKKAMTQKYVRSLPKYTAGRAMNRVFVLDIDNPLFKQLLANYRKSRAASDDLFICRGDEMSRYINKINGYKEVVYL